MNRPESLPPKRWQVAPIAPPQLKQQLSYINEVLLQILYNRGITDSAHIQAFIEGHYLESDDPFRLPDMKKAVERIHQANQNEEQIVIYGDFDADGVTSTVLLTEALRGLGFERRQVRPYIPDRVDEGYGLNFDALTKIRNDYNADLVITVDCGIRSVPEVEHANALGMDMILTDHHSIGPQMPPALAVINPKREDSTYPEKMLAGVGIAYKLAQALHSELPSTADFHLASLLDLVAVGTVADIAPLIGENRRLVTDGLKVLNTLQRPGISALAQITGVKAGRITAESIGYTLGPRINAAGRLDHAYSAAKLLATNNLLHANHYAKELNDLNRRRQTLTTELTQRAEALIEDPEDHLLIAIDQGFASGIVGLVASRLKENYYRPSIVLEQGEEVSQGSCRSIPEFHITHALDQVSDLLERYGGHAQAAGLTIRNENLPEFTARMSDIATSALAGEDLYPTLPIDAELELDQVDLALHDLLLQLEPTGAANATPVFLSRNVQVVNSRVVGRDHSHLQLEVASPTTGRSIKCIAFRQGPWINQLPDHIDIVYTLNLNEWRGRFTLQLNIQDIRPAS